MTGVNAEIALSISAELFGLADLGTPKIRLTPISVLEQYSAGTDAVNKADLLFSDNRTLSASASENLDLAGVLADAFGGSIVAAEIVAIYINAAAGNTNSIVVGGAASNPFLGPLGATGTYTIKPGERYIATSQSGWAVTAGTGDLLKILNGGAGTSVSYDIVLIGRTIAA